MEVLCNSSHKACVAGKSHHLHKSGMAQKKQLPEFPRYCPNLLILIEYTVMINIYVKDPGPSTQLAVSLAEIGGIR